MSIRLTSSNSETAKRTLEAFKPVQQVSMSNDEARRAIRQSDSNRRLHERLEQFRQRASKR